MSHNDQKLDWTVGYAEEQLKAARLAEQERIIKLLEDNETLGCGYLIALIKGESEPVGNSDKLEHVSKSYELGENK